MHHWITLRWRIRRDTVDEYQIKEESIKESIVNVYKDPDSGSDIERNYFSTTLSIFDQEKRKDWARDFTWNFTGTREFPISLLIFSFFVESALLTMQWSLFCVGVWTVT